MRKFLITIILTLLIAPISAQKLGFIAGPELTHGTVIAADKNATFSQVPLAGAHVGLLFEMDVTNRWGFDVAAMYEYRNMRWNLSHNDIDTATIFYRSIGYLNVPFHFYVNFPTQDIKYSIFAGPVFGCGLHARDMAWFDLENRKPRTYLTKDIFEEKGRIVRCEVALEAGFAMKFAEGVQIRASYQYGLNNLTRNKYRFTLPLMPVETYFTQGELKISVAYLFDLRK